MHITRHKTRTVKIGNVSIGGNHPIAIQSMVKTKTQNIQRALREIEELNQAGCEIVRLAVQDSADARALQGIKQQARIPIVADIHFDWHLALQAIDNGVDKIRLNPGNIYKHKQVYEVARAAKARKISIRVGANSGSLREKFKTTSSAMVKSVLSYIKILEEAKFYDIVISLKASSILDTLEAYRLMRKACDYPFHLGLTATGSPFPGAVKSAIAIGSLLMEGIGDTIRVSLTSSSLEEVRVAKVILEALGLRNFGYEIISCPTCGRCRVDLVKMVAQLERQLSAMNYQLSARPLKVAIMGCVVNGPGEARQADIGVAFGSKEGLLFRKGKPVKKVSQNAAVKSLCQQIRRKGHVQSH